MQDKDKEIKSLKARIEILQEQIRCLKNAKSTYDKIVLWGTLYEQISTDIQEKFESLDQDKYWGYEEYQNIRRINGILEWNYEDYEAIMSYKKMIERKELEVFDEEVS